MYTPRNVEMLKSLDVCELAFIIAETIMNYFFNSNTQQMKVLNKTQLTNVKGGGSKRFEELRKGGKGGGRG